MNTKFYEVGKLKHGAKEACISEERLKEIKESVEKFRKDDKQDEHVCIQAG